MTAWFWIIAILCAVLVALMLTLAPTHCETREQIAIGTFVLAGCPTVKP